MGNSVQASKDHPSRYKMTRRALLPKFGAEKNSPPGRAGTEQPTSQAMKTETADLAAPAPKKTWAPRPAGFPPARWVFQRHPFVPRAVTAAIRPAVQSELSLDAVKVVRNDLSDADLELVPLGQATSPFAPPAPRAITRMWDRLTAQLFGAGKA